jgi:hypothetical protein
MKAPPDAVRPITAEKLREIIRGLGSRYTMPPPDSELVAVASELTKMQRCNDPPAGWWENPKDFSIQVKGGAVRVQTPVWLQGAFARGQAEPPWTRRKKNWGDLAPDIAAHFRQLYPGRKFGDRDGTVALFVAEVIRLVLPNQKPSVRAVGLRLARKARTHRTAHNL